jgi:hypothetical protein
MTLFMVAGAAIAVAQGGLRALPLVGPLVSSLFRSAPKPAPRVEPHRHRATPQNENGKNDTEAPKQPPATESAAPAPAPTSEPPQKSPGEMPSRMETRSKAEVPTSAPREAARTVALREAGPHRKSGGQHSPAPPQAETSPAPSEDPIVAESRSFAAVIEAWHRRHDSSSALALLDLHQRRYPAGHMRLETHVLRAELYLAQGRSSDALAVLDGLSLSGLPRERELQTVRGELRAKAGRCVEARADLTAVLEKNLVDSLAKRASQSLSQCP